uniref:iron-containing alcohol dehydrogenase family protein n=1 Tax=Candidatus Electrothrix sp. TaxID=2170559 RepID=UPI004057C4B2
SSDLESLQREQKCSTGVYRCRVRELLTKVLCLYSEGLDESFMARIRYALKNEDIHLVQEISVLHSSFEQAQDIFEDTAKIDLIIGCGGGKTLDVAKYVSFLRRIPYIALPTALSNDGFCSPQCSLDFKGKKRTLPAAMPYGVVVDTEVCLRAPKILWLSGIGDLVSKITAVQDWKLAFNIKGTQVDDFAALLSDATVFQLMAKPEHDLESMRLLATALMLNGIAMEICGSSRPASGSEHLISHALDRICKKPRLHGLQVGMATYLVSHLYGKGTERINRLFELTGFWDALRQDPFSRSDWQEAFLLAPKIKDDYYTILSQPEKTDQLCKLIHTALHLQEFFI